jgi:CHAT domain-containing protein
MMKRLSSNFFLCIFCLLCVRSYCQFENTNSYYTQIKLIDNNNNLPDKEKLAAFYDLKNKLEQHKIANDSNFVLLLIKISDYELKANKNYDEAVHNLKSGLKINAQLNSKGSKALTASAYYKLGLIYDNTSQYIKALNFYDSTILLSKQINDTNDLALNSRFSKTDIYFITGDYDKAVDEANLGMGASLQKKDTSDYIYFLNRKAQALLFENEFQLSLKDAFNALSLARKTNYKFEEATSYKTIALIYEGKKMFDSALSYFNKTITTRLLTNWPPQIASDYNDLGNFYLNSADQYEKSIKSFKQALVYADKTEDSLSRLLKKSMIYTNLAEVALKQRDLNEAEKFFLSAFSNLNINTNNFLNSPSFNQLSSVLNKDLVVGLMNDKIKFVLMLYQRNKQNLYFEAFIRNARLTDSLLTQLRHEQLGEQSKLYWRGKTTEFFSNVLEACFISNDTEDAFHFLEKSRAVLLNDQLNELGASALLPQKETEKQETYQANIILLQQRLSTLTESSNEYSVTLNQLLNAKETYEAFMKYIEKNYPAYYEYKYSDSVSSLTQFQSYLAKNHQSFVHYFIGDTATYILGITPTSAKLIRLSQKQFNKDQLTQFLQLCSNKEELNNHYDVFAGLSNSIYSSIFQPLNLPKGRTIICMDNIVIPFEALCTDTKGKNFLLNDYSFDYVYSARFLMKQFNNPAAKGNFAGFAPVSFNKNLRVVELTNAATALKSSSSYYNNDKLFTHEDATRKNFFSYAASYSIVNIFSHAKADTTDNEPVLYMQDSTIHLSELQRLNNPATKFVLLSACQTNVGKTATGEGIYSLARGFAAAGIPSVSATLWNADEETIYNISNSFNKYLSEEMNKDEALQKAKLDFIHANDRDKMLPYYWANLILIGNADAIKLSSPVNYMYIWLAIAGVALLLCSLIYWRRKSVKVNHNS